MTQNVDKLKRTQIKPYTLDKQYKVYVGYDGLLGNAKLGYLVMSYDDGDLARYCMNVLNRNQDNCKFYAWLES